MADLQERLLRLGREIDYPETPNLTTMLRTRLEQPAQRQRFDTRRLAVAAAVLIVTVGALLAIPTTRDAIAGFFGLNGVIIQRVPRLPSPTPSSGATVGERLGLGRQVTLPQAQAAVPYGISFPQALGTPDQVYLIQPADVKAVALVWLPRPGLPVAAQTGVGALVIEFPGQVQPDLFMKMLGPDATLEPVQVNSNPGYWISGKPHGFFFLDSRGNPREDTFRLARERPHALDGFQARLAAKVALHRRQVAQHQPLPGPARQLTPQLLPGPAAGPLSPRPRRRVQTLACLLPCPGRARGPFR